MENAYGLNPRDPEISVWCIGVGCGLKRPLFCFPPQMKDKYLTADGELREEWASVNMCESCRRWFETNVIPAWNGRQEAVDDSA